MALLQAGKMWSSIPGRVMVRFLNSHNRKSAAPSAHLASKGCTWIHLLAQILLSLWGFSLPFGPSRALLSLPDAHWRPLKTSLLKNSSLMNYIPIYSKYFCKKGRFLCSIFNLHSPSHNLQAGD